MPLPTPPTIPVHKHIYIHMATINIQAQISNTTIYLVSRARPRVASCARAGSSSRWTCDEDVSVVPKTYRAEVLTTYRDEGSGPHSQDLVASDHHKGDSHDKNALRWMKCMIKLTRSSLISFSVWFLHSAVLSPPV